MSAAQKMRIDPKRGFRIRLDVSRVLPPVQVPPDDQYVKRIKIQSQILTKWWGHPIYLGAVVLLPKGYDEHPELHYPTVWERGLTLSPPFQFTLDSTPGPIFEYAQDSNGQVYEIRRHDLQTGKTEPFVTGAGGAVRPTPSPDGRYLAFVRRIRGDSALFLKDLQSGKETPP